MNYFWIGVIATIAYSAGYFRGMWFMSVDRRKQAQHYEEILADYSRFLEEYSEFLKEKGIKKNDDQ